MFKNLNNFSLFFNNQIAIIGAVEQGFNCSF